MVTALLYANESLGIPSSREHHVVKPTHKSARPSAQKKPRRERHPQLTPRQRQVLRLVRDGWTNREIAQRFRLSVRTVEVHRYLLMRRLGAKNVAQLLRAAVRQRILTY